MVSSLPIVHLSQSLQLIALDYKLVVVVQVVYIFESCRNGAVSGEG